MDRGDRADKGKIIAALQRNWRAEMEGAATYRELASLESDERRRGILVRMAEAEEGHARRWAERIVALGGASPEARASAIGPSQSVLLTARVGSVEAALHKVETHENEHVHNYESQLRSLDDEASADILRDLIEDESEHARALRAMARPSAEPQSRLDAILKRERWHSSSGSWIGDAIYGVNDGLTAVFGIVSGVAGAAGASGREFVVVAGLAGMIASALSMGASAYLANKSEREVFEAELGRERREIEEHPDEEREELALFYQLKGFSEQEAVALANRLAEQPEQLLQTLAHEELGLSQERLPNPTFAAATGTISTALGAIPPVLPFFFLDGTTALVASAIVSILAHFGVGAAKSVVTARTWWKSGLEMTAVAIIVAGIAYGAGLLLKLPV
jgi:VIT1/CCC1 family predicted Fe2+/Mn2+ transporter/rubrerythrin